MPALDRLRTRIDLAQQANRPVSFAVAVGLRYRDDRVGRWAALLGYYGFFSIFPLLLSFVTVLGIVLEGRPGLQADIVNSALGRFPVIGRQLGVEQLHGSPIVVAIGILAALWAGLGVVQTLQDALNTAWSVPRGRRPSFLAKRLRSIAMLLFLAVCVISASAVTSLGTSGLRLHRVVFILTIVASLAINIVLVGGTYRILIRHEAPVRSLLPGAVTAGIALFAVQAVGVLYVTRVLKNASDTYGVFATVIGLLTWLTLQGHVVLVGNEVNVVRSGRLWPRSLRPDHPTEADERVRRDVIASAAASSHDHRL